MAFTLLPVAGFVLYIFLGQDFLRERMVRIKPEPPPGMSEYTCGRRSHIPRCP